MQGINTPKPYFTLDRDFYQGQFSQTFGTAMIFEEIVSESGESKLQLLATTQKQCDLSKIYVKQKEN